VYMPLWKNVVLQGNIQLVPTSMAPLAICVWQLLWLVAESGLIVVSACVIWFFSIWSANHHCGWKVERIWNLTNLYKFLNSDLERRGKKEVIGYWRRVFWHHKWIKQTNLRPERVLSLEIKKMRRSMGFEGFERELCLIFWKWSLEDPRERIVLWCVLVVISFSGVTETHIFLVRYRKNR
jgi:hypothetical protein